MQKFYSILQFLSLSRKLIYCGLAFPQVVSGKIILSSSPSPLSPRTTNFFQFFHFLDSSNTIILLRYVTILQSCMEPRLVLFVKLHIPDLNSGFQYVENEVVCPTRGWHLLHVPPSTPAHESHTQRVLIPLLLKKYSRVKFPCQES